MKLHKKQSKTSSCAGRSPDVHKGAVLSGRLVKSNVVADLLRSVLAFHSKHFSSVFTNYSPENVMCYSPCYFIFVLLCENNLKPLSHNYQLTI